jgi:hypothetical protein
MAVFWVLSHALMLEAASIFELLVNFWRSTQHDITEDSHLHTHCHENLKNLTVFTELAPRPYPEPDESSPHTKHDLLEINFNIIFHLCVIHHVVSSFQVLWLKFCRIFFLCATCPVHLSVFGLVT